SIFALWIIDVGERLLIGITHDSLGFLLQCRAAESGGLTLLIIIPVCNHNLTWFRRVDVFSKNMSFVIRHIETRGGLITLAAYRDPLSRQIVGSKHLADQADAVPTEKSVSVLRARISGVV